MSIRKIQFATKEFYHLYNRGNSKQKIFLDTRDYKRFVSLLFAANRKEKFNFVDFHKGKDLYNRLPQQPLVAIGAYCLMPNHFHILVSPLVESGISIFMQKLSTGYAMYFNERYKRSGSLFQGKFKAQHADNDTYLKYLFSYIHLNPLKIIRNNLVDTRSLRSSDILLLEKYEFSSFIDYYEKEKRIQEKILNKNIFPNYFLNEEHFIKEIQTWITYRKS